MIDSVNDYEINYETLLCVPHEIDGEIGAYVMERNNELYVKKHPTEIISYSCEYFGSSLEGRQKGTKAMINISHKSPIIIEEGRKIIFFPTHSPRVEECGWIAAHHINRPEKVGELTRVLFDNGKIVDLDLSMGVITNQVYRSSRLSVALDKRRIKE